LPVQSPGGIGEARLTIAICSIPQALQSRGLEVKIHRPRGLIVVSGGHQPVMTNLLKSETYAYVTSPDIGVSVFTPRSYSLRVGWACIIGCLPIGLTLVAWRLRFRPWLLIVGAVLLLLAVYFVPWAIFGTEAGKVLDPLFPSLGNALVLLVAALVLLLQLLKWNEGIGSHEKGRLVDSVALGPYSCLALDLFCLSIIGYALWTPSALVLSCWYYVGGLFLLAMGVVVTGMGYERLLGRSYVWGYLAATVLALVLYHLSRMELLPLLPEQPTPLQVAPNAFRGSLWLWLGLWMLLFFAWLTREFRVLSGLFGNLALAWTQWRGSFAGGPGEALLKVAQLVIGLCVALLELILVAKALSP